jgi:transposase
MPTPEQERTLETVVWRCRERYNAGLQERKAGIVRWQAPPRRPQTVTIRREADGWYACISCAEVPIAPLPARGQETGIDVGLKVCLVTADGQVVENPRHYRKVERRLARAQRRVSRRKNGSKRRRKAARLL